MGTSRVNPSRLETLHARAGAARWHVSVQRFAIALEISLAKRFPDTAAVQDIDVFLDSLHVEDLALAVGCAEGHETAWEAFDARYRSDLRRAAAAQAGEAEGDEIVDALFLDLFARGDGQSRRSLFEYFHGRSRLGTWLRALIAQRQIDRHRASRRLTPLDAVPDGADSLPGVTLNPDPDRARLIAELHAALDGALASLAPRDRLRLAYYHADGLTLAAIGRVLSEHEATVSRKLQRTRDELRAAILTHLVDGVGLTSAEVRQCYEAALEAGGVELDRLRMAEAGTNG